MKKLLTIIALFVSSFFFFFEDVKAYELEVDVDLTLLDENFYTFKNTMDEFVEADTTYSDNYIIYRSNSDLNMYAVILRSGTTYIPKVTVYEARLGMVLDDSTTLNRVSPSSDYKSASFLGTTGRYQNYVYYSDLGVTFIPLYANFDILMSTANSGSTVTYRYNDFTTVNTADGVDKFKTLYMINKEYQEYVGAADAVHQEELEKVSNFYTMIIDKIVYLSEVFVSNYIYLSVIVIILLIFLFKLIFRRYL